MCIRDSSSANVTAAPSGTAFRSAAVPSASFAEVCTDGKVLPVSDSMLKVSLCSVSYTHLAITDSTFRPEKAGTYIITAYQDYSDTSKRTKLARCV